MPVLRNPKGPTRSSQHTPYGRVTKFYGVYMAVIRDNQDIQRNGRLRVWIPDFGSIPENESAWYTVQYCSPFGGVTPSDKLRPATQSYDDTQTSYGMWMIPPDINNTVAVMFINGDPSRGIWIGCMFESFMNHMVPGMASSSNNYTTNGKALPVAEYNKLTRENIQSDVVTRPVATPMASGIGNQGLINDSIRGVNTSSARREAPSAVFGISTPGPKNPKSVGNRLGGNQFVMDDGDGSEYIGLKTRSGASIRIDETNGIIYIINKKGTAWFQFDDDGHVDCFGADSISFRSMKDFNIRADRDINFEAGRNINIKASKDYLGTGKVGSPMSGSGGDINIETNNDFNLTVTKDRNENILGNYDITVGGDNKINVVKSRHVVVGVSHNQTAGTEMNTSSPTIRSQSAIAHHFNGGLDFVVSSSLISMNGKAAEPAKNAELVDDIPPLVPVVQKTNVLSSFVSSGSVPTVSQLYSRDTERVATIVGRMPTFEPCPEHINKGGQ